MVAVGTFHTRKSECSELVGRSYVDSLVAEFEREESTNVREIFDSCDSETVGRWLPMSPCPQFLRRSRKPCSRSAEATSRVRRVVLAQRGVGCFVPAVPIELSARDCVNSSGAYVPNNGVYSRLKRERGGNVNRNLRRTVDRFPIEDETSSSQQLLSDHEVARSVPAAESSQEDEANMPNQKNLFSAKIIEQLHQLCLNRRNRDTSEVTSKSLDDHNLGVEVTSYPSQTSTSRPSRPAVVTAEPTFQVPVDWHLPERRVDRQLNHHHRTRLEHLQLRAAQCFSDDEEEPKVVFRRDRVSLPPIRRRPEHDQSATTATSGLRPRVTGQASVGRCLSEPRLLGLQRDDDGDLARTRRNADNRRSRKTNQQALPVAENARFAVWPPVAAGRLRGELFQLSGHALPLKKLEKLTYGRGGDVCQIGEPENPESNLRRPVGTPTNRST